MKDAYSFDLDESSTESRIINVFFLFKNFRARSQSYTMSADTAQSQLIYLTNLF